MRKIVLSISVTCLLLVLISGCANTPSKTNANLDSKAQKKSARHSGVASVDKAPFSSSYQIPDSPPYFIKNVTIWIGTGEEIQSSDIVFANGKIVSIGNELQAPEQAVQVDGTGMIVTPGIIDVHSHMGVYPTPAIPSHADGNEMVAPTTAKVWAEHSVWPQDPNFEKAIAGGVTTVQILPGSANLFGGRGVVLKNVPSVTMMGMKFPGAPHSLKMACGENPKRVYGEKGGPGTRMGNMAGYRTAWIEAQAYDKSWSDYEAKKAKGNKSAEMPNRDLEMETLRGVLKGDIRVHNHCYRADEMANMIELSKEFGYQIAAFHHAVEAYKIAPLLAENQVCAVVWADWWGFKQEAYDMIRENAALLEYAEACAIIHSDDEIQIQRLPQEVAKVVSAARRIGVNISAAQSIKWLTYNSAKSLGLEDQIGSLKEGMNADLVLWNGNPLSVYTKAEMVWIDGALRFNRNDKSVTPTSDFNLGILNPSGDRP